MKLTRFVTLDQSKPTWFCVDLDGYVVGRACTEIANIIRGKHKASFTPNSDIGDYVVVLNASKVLLTGNKEDDKIYAHYTGYIGGVKSKTAKELRAYKPEDIIRSAVWGMLPKGSLGRKMMKKLRVFSGAEHPHSGQNPVELKLKTPKRKVE